MTPYVSLILAMVVFGATISFTLSWLRGFILTPWKILVFGASFAIQYLLFSLALCMVSFRIVLHGRTVMSVYGYLQR